MGYTTREQREILDAYERGEEVEMSYKDAGCDNWFNVRTVSTTTHQFNFAQNNYRIKKPRWRAFKGEYYYFIDFNGEIMQSVENYADMDDDYYLCGNYFPSMEQAKEVLLLIKGV